MGAKKRVGIALLKFVVGVGLNTVALINPGIGLSELQLHYQTMCKDVYIKFA